MLPADVSRFEPGRERRRDMAVVAYVVLTVVIFAVLGTVLKLMEGL
jgi:hypothetical protein